MDIQLKELLETIKKEGIETADSKSLEIIAGAEKQAKAIVEKAKEEASRLIADAKREIARNQQTSKDAITQAGRDLVLNLQSRIVALFDSVIKTGTVEALQGGGLESAVTALVKAWAEKGISDIEVLLSKDELKKLEKNLTDRLSEFLKKGVILKPVTQIEAGFRIGEKNGAAYYDFTAEGIAEILAEYLNPKLSEIMKKAVEGGR